jgi:hypothetical protein
MKAFLKRLLFFAMLTSILGIGLDQLLDHLLSQTKEYPGEFEVMNDIYDGAANCDLAIYGSSRAWNHVDPRILQDSLGMSCYNFGLNGQNFWLQYLRHLEFIEHNGRPRYILMSLDMFSFQPKNEIYNKMQFYPYMLFNKNIREYTENYKGFNTLDYYVPLLRYSGKRKALSIIAKNILDPKRNAHSFRFRGFAGLDTPWTDDFDNAKAALGVYKVPVDTAIVRLFDEFLDECARTNTKVILLYSPEFIKGQEFVSNRDTIMDIFRDFAAEHDLRFLDYSDDELCHSQNLFFNASHLNSKGANLFSQELARDLKPIVKRIDR